MTRPRLVASLVVTTFLFGTPTSGQTVTKPSDTSVTPPPADSTDDSEEQEIVVTGQKPRGSVIGDIPPETTLKKRDIRATGATSITEVLAAIGPQIGSIRGRGSDSPVLLLNGQRISGVKEVRDLPPEAIARVEILPEEVALKYGYAADQRVVNTVLRRHFRSTTARVDAETATEGGYANDAAEISRLIIDSSGRANFTIHAEGNTAIIESERDIPLQSVLTQPQAIDPRRDRTLKGSQRLVRATGTINRAVLGGASATLNVELSHTFGQSLFGVPTGILTVPVTSPFAAEGARILRGTEALGPLTRDIGTNAAHLGLLLNGNKKRWQYSVIGNSDLSSTIRSSDRGLNLAAMQSLINAADPALDPLGKLFLTESYPRDRSRSTTTSVGLDGMLSGPLVALPAGRANLTLKAGVDTEHLNSVATRRGISRSGNIGRDHGVAFANVDLPIARSGGELGKAIGQLTFNANAEVAHVSDFGTLTKFGAGANWSPVPRLHLITSWTREEVAPSLANLGDPILITDNTREFDHARGTTELVAIITGGNPTLLVERRKVLKIGGNWQPWETTDFLLRADFVNSRVKNPIEVFPGPSAALEAAFPERFSRNPAGDLTFVDFRPVNYDSSRNETLRLGFDFSQPLKSASLRQSLLDEARDMQARSGDGGAAHARGHVPHQVSGAITSGRGKPAGRLTLSVTDTIALLDKANLRPGIPALDYLHGSAVSGNIVGESMRSASSRDLGGGGRPRHLVEAQAGYYDKGFGARLVVKYQSGTSVKIENGDLAFSPLTTVDFRLFGKLDEVPSLITTHPWLRGVSVRFEVHNVFNERQKVRDSHGTVPARYEGNLLDPVGRTISFSLRKLFRPIRSSQTRQPS